MSFYDIIEKHDPKLVLQEIEAMTAADVQRALAAEQLDLRDFMALLSPAAEAFIEEIAQRAHEQAQRMAEQERKQKEKALAKAKKAEELGGGEVSVLLDLARLHLEEGGDPAAARRLLERGLRRAGPERQILELLSEITGLPGRSVSGFAGAFAVLTLLTYPFVYLLAAARFRQIAASLEDAVRIHGGEQIQISLDQFIERVDKALYSAKERGRNRVCVDQ